MFIRHYLIFVNIISSRSNAGTGSPVRGTHRLYVEKGPQGNGLRSLTALLGMPHYIFFIKASKASAMTCCPAGLG